ncbi:hypothetical protein ACQPW1_00565 [Nocardia sp. CA-128927]|uniref:hypothetical protein n=1 Tax=Nocardia sp. CA-128927 TaxID=3239975 RepID=UPI003D95E832
MTEPLDPDSDYNPLFGGWTADGLLSQFERWQEWTAGTYFSSDASRRIPFENDPDRQSSG